MTMILFLFFGAGVQAAQFDPPDLQFEARLHEQYLHSLSAPHLSPEALGPGLIENYELQKGENLRSLSQMLYGDSTYWPKVWARTQGNTSPQLIRKGHTLQFLLGSEDEAPAFRFTETDESGVEMTSQREPNRPNVILAAMAGPTSPAPAGQNPQIEIPPPEVEPRPVLRQLRTFPEYQHLRELPKDNISLDDRQIEIERQAQALRLPLSGYVQDAPLESVGQFLETEKESGLPVALQYVYVKVKKSVGKIGLHLLIVRDNGTIHKLNDQVQGQIKSHAIQIFGDVEITSVAAATFHRSSDEQNYDIFRAIILHANDLSWQNYDLIVGETETVDLKHEGPSGSTVAQVIGSTKHEASALYGQGDIVFINRGSQDGVAPGQLFDLYIDRSIRDASTPVRFSNVASGTIKIVKTSHGSATAVILTAIDSILQGDRAQAHQQTNTGQLKMPPASTGSSVEPTGDEVQPSDEVPLE